MGVSVHLIQARQLHLLSAGPCAAVNHLGLIPFIERFSQRVGVEIARASHRRDDPGVFPAQGGAQQDRLRPPVGMMAHPLLRTARRDGVSDTFFLPRLLGCNALAYGMTVEKENPSNRFWRDKLWLVR